MEQAEHRMVRFPQQSPVAEEHEGTEVWQDARLLRSIAQGNQCALSALYRRRSAQLYSLLCRMLVSEVEAQEVMQDTFLRIWRRAHEHDSRRSSPLAWMIMIARGLALDRLRARARRSAGHLAYEQEIASLASQRVLSASPVERDELAVACADALQRLPEAQSRAVRLAFFRGWTHEEIARAEGEPLGTIKARIRRGLIALREALKEYHG